MISFGELLLIALVSLLVIGPRRLPETVRFVALHAGRLRQALTDTRKMVEDELGMDDIRRQLHNEQVMRSLNATREQIERAAHGLPPAPKNETSPDSIAQSDDATETDKSHPDSSSTPETPGATTDTSTIAASESGDSADDVAPPHDISSHYTPSHNAEARDKKTP